MHQSYLDAKNRCIDHTEKQESGESILESGNRSGCLVMPAAPAPGLQAGGVPLQGLQQQGVMPATPTPGLPAGGVPLEGLQQQGVMPAAPAPGLPAGGVPLQGLQQQGKTVYLNVRAGFKVALRMRPAEITETSYLNGLTEVVDYGRYQTAIDKAKEATEKMNEFEKQLKEAQDALKGAAESKRKLENNLRVTK